MVFQIHGVPGPMAAGRGRGRAAAPGGTLQGAVFEGRKFGILAFALQCVSVRLYLFLIYSVYSRTGVASWRGGTTDLCRPPGGKNGPSRRH